MVAALAPNEARARALADRALIGQRDLERGVYRFGAGVGEEYPVEPYFGTTRCDRRQPRSEFKCAGMAHLKCRGIIQLLQLSRHGLRDLGAAMTGVDAPQTGGTIQDLVSVHVTVVHALGALKNARRFLELPVGGERHPVMIEILRIGGGGHVRFSFLGRRAGPARAAVI
jgi:hypothetical protein